MRRFGEGTEGRSSFIFISRVTSGVPGRGRWDKGETGQEDRRERFRPRRERRRIQGRGDVRVRTESRKRVRRGRRSQYVRGKGVNQSKRRGYGGKVAVRDWSDIFS